MSFVRDQLATISTLTRECGELGFPVLTRMKHEPAFKEGNLMQNRCLSQFEGTHARLLSVFRRGHCRGSI